MIDLQSIGEIVATYSKHGWLLRRVLLIPDSMTAFSKSPTDAFESVPVHESKLDAAWFSRPPKTGGVAWELRYLGSTPFALVEHADEDSEEFENVLAEVEGRLMSAIAKKHTA